MKWRWREWETNSPHPWGGASCCLPLFLASIHVPPTPGEWPQHYKEPSVKVKVCFLEKQDWGPNIAMAKGSRPPDPSPPPAGWWLPVARRGFSPAPHSFCPVAPTAVLGSVPLFPVSPAPGDYGSDTASCWVPTEMPEVLRGDRARLWEVASPVLSKAASQACGFAEPGGVCLPACQVPVDLRLPPGSHHWGHCSSLTKPLP